MKQVFKKVERISRDRMQELAIREQWFTIATNQEYEMWFCFADWMNKTKEVDTNVLASMASFVKMHSETSSEIEEIMYMIYFNCVVVDFERMVR